MAKDVPYIDKELGKAIYSWLSNRKDPTKPREYPLTPEEEIRLLLVTRLILEYGYSPEQIDLEVEIKSGQMTLPKRADIVIFRNAKGKDPEANAYVICEVKKKDRKDGLDQLETYINNTTTEFGIWWNGEDIVYLHRLKEPHKFEEIPDIPRKGETLEDVGTWSKEKLVIATDLIKVFNTIHNHIYANEGFLKEKVFNEILKFIFMKMVDERLPEPKPYFRITATEMEAVREGKGESFNQRIETIWTRVKKEYGDVFNEDERINLQLTSQAFVVSQFQRFDFRRTPADIKGTAFQTFVYAHQRGERGEFFTPHPVAELMVKMMAPSDPEAVLDPACGSGGLLVRAMLHAWQKIDKAKHLNELEKKERKYTYARYYIRGIDFNPDLARVSKMHMVVYDDGHTGVFCANSLENLGEIKESAIRRGAIRESEALKEGFEVVLTNPPFGAKGKVTDKRILQQFDLGFKWVKDKKTGRWYKTDKIQDGQTPEILFTERCMQFLKPYGRMAIVLPDGILSNSTLGYVRQWIMDNARVLASVSLPSEAFVPYGSGIKASVLFLQKLPLDEVAKLKEEGYDIFFAYVKKVGYDVRGREIHKRDEKGELVLDEHKEPRVDTDIPNVIEAFKAFRRERGLKFRAEEELENPNFFALKGAAFSVVPFNRIIGRLKFESYSKDNLDRIDKITKARYQPLREIGKVVCGPFGTAILEKDYRKSGIPLIRVTNVKHMFVSSQALVFIDESLSDRFPSTKVREGDIVVSQRGAIGSIGQFAIATAEFSRWNISANLIGIKDIEINPWYLLAFLNSSFGQYQILALLSGQAQPKITTEDIESILVPQPSDSFQSHIAFLVREAYDKRKSADGIYKQAEGLLHKALGIEELKLSLEQTYEARSKELEGSGTFRFDADFYQPRHLRMSEFLRGAPQLNETALVSEDAIDPTTEPSKSFKYISLKSVNGTTGEIEEIEEFLGWQAPSRARLQVKAKDILVSSLKGSLDKVGLVPEELDNSIASTGFFVVREKEEGLPAEVLFLLFRAPILSLQLERISSGAILEAVPKGEFNKIKVAIPKNQKLIPVIVSLVRESFALRRESRQRIEQAKTEVEEYIEKEAENISTSGGEFAKG